MRRPILLAAFIAFVTALVFSPVLTAEFVEIDDQPNIVDNTHVHALNGENLKWMFSDLSLMRRYVPCSWLTWAITAQLFGVKPFVFHLEGLLFHIVNAVLVFFLLRKLLSRFNTKGTLTDKHVDIASAIAALLWAIHPMRVEVVGWANCQMYSQTLFFALLALGFYFRAVESKPSSSRSIMGCAAFWFSVICFTVSLLTYPTMVGFVVVLLVLDIYFFRRLSSSPWHWNQELGVILEKAPYILVTLGAAGITLWARQHMSAHWIRTEDMTHFTWAHRIAQAFYIWAYYLWRPFWPLNLTPFYTRLLSFQPLEPAFLLSTIAIGGISIFLFLRRTRWPLLFGLWLCHLALLVPMLGLTEHPHYSSDRYNHIEGILFAVLIAWGLARLWIERKAFCVAAAAIFLSISAVLSFEQLHLWHNKVIYTQEIIARLLREGTKEAPGLCAIEYNRLGGFYSAAGQTEDAVTSYIESIRLEPKLPSARENLTVLIHQPEHTEAAVAHFVSALQKEPSNVLASCMLAEGLASKGDWQGALKMARSVQELSPANGAAIKLIGLSLAESGDCDRALPYLEKASDLNAESGFAQYEIGTALMSCNLPEKAIKRFTLAVKLKPLFGSAQLNLGSALASVERLNEALPHLQEASRLQPNAPQVLVPLAMALAENGNKEEARLTYEKAIQLARQAGQTELVSRIEAQARTLDSNENARR